LSDSSPTSPSYVSRGGLKLAHALQVFNVDPAGWTCADLGCHAGGFTDCLLQHGAARVYAVDRGYGVLDYRLRRDPRVVVMERTDARGLVLPTRVEIVTIDAGWTRQKRILPTARDLLADGGGIISLVKPHYEADPEWLRDGVLPAEMLDAVMQPLRSLPADLGLSLMQETPSPIAGHAGNREYLWWLRPRCDRDPNSHING
jgi:23S rRNA (cytidine1920-2'-O)/16S rRNA (cytidine1409-2'-O)-methyltransferase